MKTFFSEINLKMSSSHRIERCPNFILCVYLIECVLTTGFEKNKIGSTARKKINKHWFKLLANIA